MTKIQGVSQEIILNLPLRGQKNGSDPVQIDGPDFRSFLEESRPLNPASSQLISNNIFFDLRLMSFVMAGMEDSTRNLFWSPSRYAGKREPDRIHAEALDLCSSLEDPERLRLALEFLALVQSVVGGMLFDSKFISFVMPRVQKNIRNSFPEPFNLQQEAPKRLPSALVECVASYIFSDLKSMLFASDRICTEALDRGFSLEDPRRSLVVFLPPASFPLPVVQLIASYLLSDEFDMCNMGGDRFCACADGEPHWARMDLVSYWGPQQARTEIIIPLSEIRQMFDAFGTEYREGRDYPIIVRTQMLHRRSLPRLQDLRAIPYIYPNPFLAIESIGSRQRGDAGFFEATQTQGEIFADKVVVYIPFSKGCKSGHPLWDLRTTFQYMEFLSKAFSHSSSIYIFSAYPIRESLLEGDPEFVSALGRLRKKGVAHAALPFALIEKGTRNVTFAASVLLVQKFLEHSLPALGELRLSLRTANSLLSNCLPSEISVLEALTEERASAALKWAAIFLKMGADPNSPFPYKASQFFAIDDKVSPGVPILYAAIAFACRVSSQSHPIAASFLQRLIHLLQTYHAREDLILLDTSRPGLKFSLGHLCLDRAFGLPYSSPWLDLEMARAQMALIPGDAPLPSEEDLFDAIRYPSMFKIIFEAHPHWIPYCLERLSGNLGWLRTLSQDLKSSSDRKEFSEFVHFLEGVDQKGSILLHAPLSKLFLSLLLAQYPTGLKQWSLVLHKRQEGNLIPNVRYSFTDLVREALIEEPFVRALLEAVKGLPDLHFAFQDFMQVLHTGGAVLDKIGEALTQYMKDRREYADLASRLNIPAIIKNVTDP